MTKSFALGAALALATLAVSAPAHAVDPWEGGINGDDTSTTINTLSPGLAQQHDLDQAGGANDVDWAVVPTLQYHSYEARLSGTNVNFDWGIVPDLRQFERVNKRGTILTEDVATVNNWRAGFGGLRPLGPRWLGVGEHVRGVGPGHRGERTEGPTHVYTLRYWDTTYTVPCWNSSGGQTTVL